MATFDGSYRADTITPEYVSSRVWADPTDSRPSDKVDNIDGYYGNDILDGGRGADIIHGGEGSDSIYDGYDVDGFQNRGAANNGNVIHGDGGNDEIWIHAYDTGGANPVDNTIYGDDGNDIVSLVIGDYMYVVDEDTEWVGAAPTGSISLHGGTGNDDLGVTSYVLSPGMTTSLYGDAGADSLTATMRVYEADGSWTGGRAVQFSFTLTGNPGRDVG